MSTYLLNPQVGLANAAGFPALAGADADAFVLKIPVDLAKIQSNVTTAAAQSLGTFPKTYATLTAADVVKLANLPAGCAVKNVFVNVTTAQTGGTSPTVSLGPNGTATGYINAASLSGTGIAADTGSLLKGGTDATALHLPHVITADTTLDMSFGGTLGTGGVLMVTVELVRLT